ncbi:hypothetical protein ABT160_30120 [Streptomyces sp. NPDC001941]|uniref:hypothetical protein n=1 Tax=Streptomyces sp. NPDC001941 TaxID=3154659 RepID=UPI0033263750
MSREAERVGRFSGAGLVLGPVEGRAAALCRYTGHLGAGHSAVTLAVVEGALGFAEELEGVEDVAEFEELWSAAHVWGQVPSPHVTLPELGAANEAVLEHVEGLLKGLAPEELREVALGLSVEQGMVAVALEQVEEAAAGGREFRAQSVAAFEQEMLLNEARAADAVDVLVLDEPGGWPPVQRAALVLALTWDVAALVGYAAELAAAGTLPAPLLWQAAGSGHLCAGVRVPVPGTDLLVWSRLNAQEFEGRALFAQAHQLGLWQWRLDWQDGDGAVVPYRAGHAPSRTAAQWRAGQAVREMLADPYRAKSPVTGTWLIEPRSA